MPIDYSALPLQPPAPLPAGATDAQRAEWRDLHRIAASYAQGAAQQATAKEMAAMVAEQRATTAAFLTAPAEGVPGGSNAEIVRAFTEALLAAGRSSGDALTIEAQAMLRKFRTLYPTASTGAPK